MSGVVVGIDGSHNASHALEWAMTEAGMGHADLTVITINSVIAGYWSRQPVPMPGDDEKVAEARELAETAVAKIQADLGDRQPASVQVVAKNGFPAEELIAASRDADLLVVGSRGGGGFSALAVGSITNQVVHHAKCPVVVVPAGR
jgi:nucleotide-binding universal stress UspA family protein